MEKNMNNENAEGGYFGYDRETKTPFYVPKHRPATAGINGSGYKPEPAIGDKPEPAKVGVRICNGVLHIKENGAVRKCWLGELDESELRGFLAVFLAEIHALVEHRGRIYEYVRAVNGELDRRVNEKACKDSTPCAPASKSTPCTPASGGH